MEICYGSVRREDNGRNLSRVSIGKVFEEQNLRIKLSTFSILIALRRESLLQYSLSLLISSLLSPIWPYFAHIVLNAERRMIFYSIAASHPFIMDITSHTAVCQWSSVERMRSWFGHCQNTQQPKRRRWRKFSIPVLVFLWCFHWLYSFLIVCHAHLHVGEHVTSR